MIPFFITNRLKNPILSRTRSFDEYFLLSPLSYLLSIKKKKYKTINKYHITMESILIYFCLLLFAATYTTTTPHRSNPKARSQVESISKFPSLELFSTGIFFCSTSFNRRTFSIIRDGTRSKFNSKRNRGVMQPVQAEV